MIDFRFHPVSGDVPLCFLSGKAPCTEWDLKEASVGMVFRMEDLLGAEV